jgi:hypothetical protein
LRHKVTIEEIDDDDVQRLNAKIKLKNTTHILESDDDEPVFDHRKAEMPPKMSAKHTPVQIPTTEGMRYKRP